MLDYGMLAEGDRVLVAVSGGVDSLVLAWLLDHWRGKAPINYTVHCVHVDMDPGPAKPGRAAAEVQSRLARLGLACTVLAADLPAPASSRAAADSRRDVCYRCARSRRNQLFAHAREKSCNTIALGHHRDDIIETFFMNLTCAGNISTMRPRQVLFSGRLNLIRPLAYLDKETVTAIGSRLQLMPVRSTCPLSEETRRSEVRALLSLIYERIPGSRDHIFAALGNVRGDYLLQPQEKIHADNP